jgi:ABC-type Zn uptake system ZnuABC Zn-binding protein ZnuA
MPGPDRHNTGGIDVKQPKKKYPVINITGDVVRFEIATVSGEEPDVYELKPHEVVEIAEAYATRRQALPGRDSAASVIENLTNARVLPVCDPRAKSLYESTQAEKTKGARKAS